MKKHLLPLFFVTALFASCYQHEDLNVSTIRVSREKKNTIYDNILNYADFIRNGKKHSRSLDSYTINPYLNNNGDTIAYIVNYAQGWELLSNDRRAPMVLASSPKGTFNIEDIKNTDNLNSFWSEMEKSLTQLKSTPTTDDDILGEGWNALYVKNESIPEENIVKTKAAFNETRPGENGYWLLLDSETITKSDEMSGHQITTEWNQYMNFYIPKKPNTAGDSIHCVAGCNAVAGAQYLLYLHDKYNNPRYMVDDGKYDAQTNSFIFSGSSDQVWNKMREPLLGTGNASIMIGYIAKEINTDFGLNLSTANIYHLINFINSKYGYSLTSHNYSSESIINILKQEGAILAAAWEYNNPIGHTFLIDAYRILKTETTSTYGWVGEDNLGQDTNDWDSEGNPVGFAFITTQTVTNTNSSIFMNWGQIDDTYNDVGFSIYTTNWTMGEHAYNTNKLLFY